MIKCVAVRCKSLVASQREQYGCRASAKSDAGIDLLSTVTGDTAVLYRALGYTSMVGQAGASKDAPDSCNSGKVNLVWFHHP